MLLEERRDPPWAESAREANAKADIYDRDWQELWETEGRERVTWVEPFSTVCEWEPPDAQWSVGGKLNGRSTGCAPSAPPGLGDKVAYHWEGEPEGDRRDL